MQRDGHHILALVKSRLHTVAVMRVHVEIQNPFPGVGQFQAGERHVVQKTEARRALRHGVMKTAQQIEGDVRPALQQQVGGDQSRAAGPGAAFEHVLEHRRVRSAQAHVQALDGQITAGGALQFLEIAGRVKLFQFGQRGFSRGDLDAPVGAEQSKRFQALAGESGALGFERAIWRVAQPFNFGRVQKGQFAIAHAERVVMPLRTAIEEMKLAPGSLRNSLSARVFVGLRFKVISSCPDFGPSSERNALTGDQL